MDNGYELTDEQRAIRDAPQSTRLIIAPPGSGKTEALALRALGLIEHHQSRSPRKILAVTFSNRARDNLLQRFRSVLGRQRTQHYLTVCNFHGLAARIYWSHGQRLDHELSQMQVPRRGWIEEKLKEKRASRGQSRRVKSLLQESKLSAVDDERLLEQLAASGNELAVTIESERQDARQLDYADLLRYAQILVTDENVAQPYREHFSHILVDEFQDVTPQQAFIIESISGRNVTWAGDPGQAIYSFAGADPSWLEARIRRQAEKVHEFELTHRSSPAVVDVLNLLSIQLGLNLIACARPERWQSGGAAHAYTFHNRKQEARCVRFLAEEVIGDDDSASVAVITRGQFRREEIDREFSENYAGVTRFWGSALTSSRTARCLTQALNTMGEVLDDSETVVSELLHRTRATIDDSEIDCLEELRLCDLWLREALDNGLTLREAVGRVQISENADVAIGPGVHLLNAHVGKGQEFDHVIICGLERDSIPSKFAETTEEIAEEMRVLRVIVSRAKTSCVFTRTTTRESWNGGSVRVFESRWWELVTGACHS